MQPAETNTEDINKIPLSSIEMQSGYWRKLYARKRRLHDVSPQEILIGQLFTLAVTMIAGIYISKNKEALLLVGTTFIVYPILAELLSSNTAVLISGLHHELDQTKGSKLSLIVTSIAKTR